METNELKEMLKYITNCTSIKEVEYLLDAFRHFQEDREDTL
jgi:hypothetical protein